MEDIESLTIGQMLARRSSAEQEASRLIGQLVFSFSRLVNNLHLCVAWHNDGKDLDRYGDAAGDLAAADLIKRIERQAASRFGEDSKRHKKYKYWTARAHKIREQRNIIMHSRWSIEPYGRHAVAISTPIFVEPKNELVYTLGTLADICADCEQLTNELAQLRTEHPL
ncbi:hypothetical protein ACTT2I_16625 [Stenotrophomonas sp. PUT21]|uniref:hypothetical protein n=1 Tax=Stenotrophomonas sp. PUT21 TaxID=3456954 RepID=UPI003FCE5581